MNAITRWKALALAVLLVCPAPVAMAIGTVSDGGVSFGYPTNFTTVAGNTVNADFTGAAAGDQLFESWWFFRTAADTQEFAFGLPDAEDYTLNSGTTGRLDWNDPGGLGLFSAALAFEVIETGTNQGVVFQSMTITNTGPAPLVIDLFHYIDLDLSGTFGNDQASFVANPDGIEMLITDRDSSAPLIGYDADAYQVTTYGDRAALRNLLTDGNADDLDNSGLDFGGRRGADFTGALQWSVTIDSGEFQSFLTQFGSDAALEDPSVSAVPEPGPALLAGLGLMGLSIVGRGRN